MKYLFGNMCELTEKQIVGGLYDSSVFLILINHAGEDLLLGSTSDLVYSNLQLIISYLKFAGLTKEAVALKEIDGVYQRTIGKRSQKETLANFRKKIVKILKGANLTIIDMWGCPTYYCHSLRDFPRERGKAEEAYKNK